MLWPGPFLDSCLTSRSVRLGGPRPAQGFTRTGGGLLNHDAAGLLCRRTKTGGVAPVMRYAGAKSYAAERWPTTPLTSNWPTNLCSLLALRRTVSALLCRIAAVSRMSLED